MAVPTPTSRTSPPDPRAHASERSASRPGRSTTVGAWIAATLGLLSAATSVYWLAGGTGLLDTVGGDIERWGRQRSAPVLLVLAVVVVVKIGVAVAAPILVGVGADRLPGWTRSRVPRVLGWIAAVVLVAYGGLLTVAGVLVVNGVIDEPADADHRALVWHAALWDPWFLAWGIAFVVALAGSKAPYPRSDSRFCHTA